MHGLQHTMLRLVDLRNPGPRRFPPRQKHDSVPANPRNEVDRLLRELFPPLAGVAVGLVCAHGETSVEHEDAPLGPGDEETPVVGWWDEVGVVLFDSLVDVD